MENWGLTLIIAIVAVGIFVLGISLTLMIKGHHVKSEIGDNENLKKHGIVCTAQQFRNEEGVTADDNINIGCQSCSGCNTGQECKNTSDADGI